MICGASSSSSDRTARRNEQFSSRFNLIIESVVDRTRAGLCRPLWKCKPRKTTLMLEASGIRGMPPEIMDEAA